MNLSHSLQKWKLQFDRMLIPVGVWVALEIRGAAQNRLCQLFIDRHASQRSLPRSFRHNAPWFCSPSMVRPHNHRHARRIDARIDLCRHRPGGEIPSMGHDSGYHSMTVSPRPNEAIHQIREGFCPLRIEDPGHCRRADGLQRETAVLTSFARADEWPSFPGWPMTTTHRWGSKSDFANS